MERLEQEAKMKELEELRRKVTKTAILHPLPTFDVLSSLSLYMKGNIFSLCK